MKLSFGGLLAGLVVLVVVTSALSLAIGPVIYGPTELLATIAGDASPATHLIVTEIRLPRTLLALTIGASLGLSGAALQGFLRNSLAEPGVIGVSAAAAFGAVVAIYTGLSQSWALALPLLATGGGLLAVLVLQVLARRGGVLVLILAGVAMTSLFGALTSLALNLSPNPFAALEIVFWTLGSVTDRSMDHLFLALPFMAVGWLLLLASARSLDVLSLGEEAAVGLGVNLVRTQWLVVLGTALAVGAATAVAGIIGFVGLVVPHLLRPLIGHRPSILLPASALGGALLLLCADLGVRLVTPQTELKLGVLTALIGAPFFLWLILHHRGGLDGAA